MGIEKWPSGRSRRLDLNLSRALVRAVEEGEDGAGTVARYEVLRLWIAAWPEYLLLPLHHNGSTMIKAATKANFISGTIPGPRNLLLRHLPCGRGRGA